MAVATLCVEDLRKHYRGRGGEIIALDGIGFDIEEPGIVGLLGQNGAGLRSLLKRRPATVGGGLGNGDDLLPGVLVDGKSSMATVDDMRPPAPRTDRLPMVGA